MASLTLPNADGRLENYKMTGVPIPLARRSATSFPRIAFAAAHVVADPLADNDPWLTPAIDWDKTLAFRHRLWDLGLGVAEAMDTAQRGMGLGWTEAKDLMRRSFQEARGRSDALIAGGAGTDHLQPVPGLSLNDVMTAYEKQVAAVEGMGGRIILMASRALAAVAKGPEDYLAVYDRILRQVREPVIIHWLGEMFDPALEGYWGSKDHWAAMETCLQAIQAHPHKVDGIKVSLLSKEKEVAMRARLPDGVRMFTGDDFNYAELIAGDSQHASDALLGIFDAIAPAASAALAALGEGKEREFFDLLDPTVPLSRHIFKAPTRFYKTGVVFLAYLNGLQDHFRMVGGQESARSLIHLSDLFQLADKARVLSDPDRASDRMRKFLAAQGIA
ncbi:dihydrodipicolinate synthase family protein [Oryzifoliimicrobium ureilyticus]|uniref:dihydrodipicolinate synthase family protein n=1 Tax=Oryzifoliimicrobium ureilyticus TaxID=3113724 RepID=UPI0030767975